MVSMPTTPTLSGNVFRSLTVVTKHFFNREFPVSTGNSYFGRTASASESAVREPFVSCADIALDDITPSDLEVKFLRNLLDNNLGRPRVTISESHVAVE